MASGTLLTGISKTDVFRFLGTAGNRYDEPPEKWPWPIPVGVVIMKVKRVFIAGIAAVSFCAAPALGADLAVKAPPLVPVATWTGCYVGFNAGYGWGKVNNNVNYLPSAPAFGEPPVTQSNSTQGALGGGQVGCNYQYGSSWVVGLEADYDFTDISGSAKTLIPPGIQAANVFGNDAIDGLGTVRGRIGFLVAPQWLVYGTGGLAYGRVDTSTSFVFANGVSYIYPGSATWKDGWTAGGGVEWAFASHLSLKVEYLYVSLGSLGTKVSSINGNPNFAVTSTYSTIAENILRVGVNLKF